MPDNKGHNDRATLMEVVKEAENACTSKDFVRTENLYTTAIGLDTQNPFLYSNRSVARVYLKKYEEALSDAEKCLAIDPNYVMGYFRHGVALQCLGDFYPAIIAFAKGMARDRKNFKFLKAMIDTALKSPLKESLQTVMSQLREMKLESNPFVISSVIGQDILAHNDAAAAIEVLECAISIDTSSLKLKGSVYSALSSALWSMENFERAIYYMKEDLKVSEALSDIPGECRAYGNLGSAHLSLNRYDEALNHHKKQLSIAQHLKDKRMIASAHSGLGLVYTALDDHKNALQHHENAVELCLATHDSTMRCRELGKVAQAKLVLGDYQDALRCQKDRLRLCKDGFDDGGCEEALAYSDVSVVYRALNMVSEEMACLGKSAEINKRLGDNINEAKALVSLGYTARHARDTSLAQITYERLLELSLEVKDKQLEGRACANLGIVHHQMGDYEMALKLQARCLKIAVDLGDTGGQGRAFGNIGNAYSALGLYDQAIKHHLQELEISSLIDDRESKCSTHGNLAVAYQALQVHDKAQYHYNSQYELAKEIGNATNEARSLMNLGNYYNTLSQYTDAIEFYKKYLNLVERYPDSSGEGRALYNMGFAFFSLHNFQEAVLCYERSVAVATNCQDKVAMARAYCNLGLARKALGDYDVAFDCQNTFLSLSTELKSTRGTFKAFGNLGDIYSAKKEPEQAIEFYQQQLIFSKQHNEPTLVAQACSSLGSALRAIGELKKALEVHRNEASIYRDIVKDMKNEYKAQGRLGATLTALGLYSEALPCYERQLTLSKTSKELLTEAQAYGNLAITYTNLEEFIKAKECFENQIDLLQNVSTKTARFDKCKAYCNIGDCSEALQLYDEAISCNQIALSLANEMKNLSLMERTCKSLSSSFRQLGKIHTAIRYSQRRLIICERIGNSTLAAATFGDMGLMYSMLGRYKDAIFYLNQEMKLGVEINDENIKGDSACSLGGVYLLMKDYDKALTFHKLDLELAQRNGNRPCQGRAYGNIAATYEAMGDYSSAMPSQEQHLFIAKEQNDDEAKLIALRGIGRNILHLPDGDSSRAILLLQQAMLLSRGLSNRDEMIMTLHDLGVAFWSSGDLQASIDNLRHAVDIAETACLDMLLPFLDNEEQLFANNELISTYKALTRCYSSLICVLCQSGQHQDALELAEKFKSFPDRIFSNKKCKNSSIEQHVPIEQMLKYASEQDTVVIYYFMTAGHLFQWFLSPQGEIIYAGHTILQNLIGIEDSNILTEIIYELRKSLGVESLDAEFEHVEDIESNDCNSNKPFFLQMLNIQATYHSTINHIKTSKGCLLPSSDAETQRLEDLKKKPPFFALHELLIAKVEQLLKKFTKQSSLSKLTLVVEGDLLLVPFCMLKKRSTDHYLSQNFLLNVVPSFYHLMAKDHMPAPFNCNRGLVVGNPSIPENLAGDKWFPSHASEEEANIAGGLFRVEPLTNVAAHKKAVLSQLECSEIVHFACHASWKQPVGIVVGCDEKLSISDIPTVNDLAKEANALDSPLEAMSENPAVDQSAMEKIVLRASDILSVDLSATKLVVLGSPHLFKSDSGIDNVTSLSKSVSFLIRSFFAAGVGAVLTSLWPVPETASRLFLQTFYKHLLEGRFPTASLAVSMEMLRASQQFEHPSYWAGFSQIGRSPCVDKRDLVTNHALREVIQGTSSFVQDTLKLVVHLIEKSFQRAPSTDLSQPLSMFTSQESVSTKLKEARGWRELFSAAGFELRSSSNGLPAAIFFPRPGLELVSKKVSSLISPFLKLSDEIIESLAKLLSSPHKASSMCSLIRDFLSASLDNKENAESIPKYLQVDRKIWQTDGACHLLTSLGLKVWKIEDSQVTLDRKFTVAADTANALLDVMNTLFDEIENYTNAISSEDLMNCGPTKPLSGGDGASVHLDYGSKVVARAIPQGLLSPKSGLTVDLDFNSSFHSMKSEDSFHNATSSDHSGHRADFGILALEEPKTFTQVPSSIGLVIPTPIMPPKPNLSHPLRLISSPGSAFSPSKRYQLPVSPGGVFQTKSPASARSPSNSSPMRSPRNPSVVTPPMQLHTKSPYSAGGGSPGGMFYQISHKPDAKVCVVTPRFENPTVRNTGTNRFVSLFDRELLKDHSFRKVGSSTSSVDREEIFSARESPSSVDHNIFQQYSLVQSRDANDDEVVTRSPTTSAYKPSPSAASLCGLQTPEHEYTHIVDKLTHGTLLSVDSGFHSPPHKGIVSSTSTTHTAFRLVQSGEKQTAGIPRLQKYKVETQISKVSTLMCEDTSLVTNENKTGLSEVSAKPKPKLSSAKSISDKGSPNEKPQNIFNHLSPSQRGSSDERMQFV